MLYPWLSVDKNHKYSNSDSCVRQAAIIEKAIVGSNVKFGGHCDLGVSNVSLYPAHVVTQYSGRFNMFIETEDNTQLGRTSLLMSQKLEY